MADYRWCSLERVEESGGQSEIENEGEEAESAEMDNNY